eukprot:GCRY01000264.1.p1 GENE.GCRY01000264.1~~GCRY01000264.1.p1  ORF type:complete len:386 (+),score=94.88 GCRY01000264.1:296-1453(+)
MSTRRRFNNSYMICGTRFDIPPKYTPLQVIGTGAYGIVIAARVEGEDKDIAIKKIGRAFSHGIVDITRALRELRILKCFNHENIISIKEVLRPECKAEFRDLYIVNDLMETDLHQIIKSDQGLSPEHVQYFMYQLVRGMKYVHSANILHRDLKPANVLVNGDCHLKICDFGLARLASYREEEKDAGFTEYVVTRWYRAPEVMLQCKTYTQAIDAWSVGCIMAELLLRKPLFPGQNYVHQLDLIVDVLGTPSPDEIHKIESDQARQHIMRMPPRRRRPWNTIFPQLSSEAVDLLNGLLQFDPAKRLTMEQALGHPYFASLHDADDEPLCEKVFSESDFEFEGKNMTAPQLKELIFDEVLFYHPEMRDEEALATPSPSISADSMDLS